MLIKYLYIRGEYKVWIYQFYIVLFIQFHFMVDHIPQFYISKVQTRVSSFFTRWLGLPRCATLASLFHPEPINVPYLPHTQDKAKLRLLASVSISHDKILQEMKNLILSPEFGKAMLVPCM